VTVLMGRIGRTIGLVGGVVYIAGMFLHYVEVGSQSQTIWQAADRLDVVVLILVLGAIACLALSFTVPSRLLPAVAAALGGAAFAFVTPIDAQTLDPFAIGMWVTALSGLAIVIGSLLAASQPEPVDAYRAPPQPGPPAAPGPPPA
jgi:peptidoglycan/LPS O-acetylase OafA/YrhL